MDDRKVGREPVDEAGVAAAEGGQVILDGPDGVAITLTPKAALGTAASLIRAAEEILKDGGPNRTDGRTT